MTTLAPIRHPDAARVIASMPEERITLAALASLPDYSMSLPTGTRIGKRWRRNANDQAAVFVPLWGPAGLLLRWPPVWVIGEYVEVPEEDKVGIRWTRAVVDDGTVASHAPPP